MLLTILFFICGYGIVNIVVREHVFDRPKNWIDKTFHYSFINKILKCETCFSWYIGCMLFWILPPISGNIYIDIFLAGCALSGFVKLILIFLYKM